MKRPLITLALILVTGLAIFAYRDSQIPRATATLEIHPEFITPPKLVPFIDSNGETQYRGPSHYVYPLQMFISAETLKLASQKFDLQMPLDETITYLKEVVTGEQREGTNLIDITVKHAPKDQAIRIANAIAEAGAERQKWTEDNASKRTLEALDQKLEAASLSRRPQLDTDEEQTIQKSLEALHGLKTKQQETRDLLKRPRIPITIHQRAK